MTPHCFAPLAARVLVLLGIAATCCIALTGSQAEEPSYRVREGVHVDARTFAGWRAIRQFDCARCHGAQYEGRIGPSLVEAVRRSTRDQFIRMLLEGNSERGMPAYRDIAGVAEHAVGIYGYFKGRADGEIASGRLLPLE